MIVREVPWDHPDAISLRAAQRAEIEQRYGTPDSEPGTPPSAADITVFFVAYAGDEAVGCGGLREIDATHGEVKRMFVAAEHRGSGVAPAILRELERFGSERGWQRIVLETGDRQPDAVRFYTREGYEPIPRFGSYVDVEASRCFAKPLDGARELSTT